MSASYQRDEPAVNRDNPRGATTRRKSGADAPYPARWATRRAGVAAAVATFALLLGAQTALGSTGPAVLKLSARHVSQASAVVTATVTTGDTPAGYRVMLLDPCPEPEECIRIVTVAHGTLRATSAPRRIRVELPQAEGNPNIEPGTTYEYWISVENGSGHAESAHQTFTTLPAGIQPSVIQERAGRITSTSATLHAQIETGWLPTEYQVWMLDPCPPPAECMRIIKVGHGQLSGTAAVQRVTVDLAEAEGHPTVEPDTTYEYWVLAQNAAGSSEGPHQVFTTRE